MVPVVGGEMVYHTVLAKVTSAQSNFSPGSVAATIVLLVSVKSGSETGIALVKSSFAGGVPKTMLRASCPGIASMLPIWIE